MKPSNGSSLVPNLRKRLVEPFLLSEHPPWYDARGVALGLLTGFGFPLGLQWASLGVFRTAVRFNIVLALVLTWVNNPLTVAPMYYGYYLIGSMLIGDSSRFDSNTFLKLMAPLLEPESFLESFSVLAHVGTDILVRWSIGASLTGLFFGTLGYIITYYVQNYRQQKKSRSC